MEVDFVPYQEALELHNIGVIFPNVGFPHFAIYRNGNLSFANQDAIKMFVEDFKDEVITAPLYQQAFRWFRGQSIPFSIVNDHSFNLTPYTFTTDHEYYYDSGSGNPWYETYEEAELACLRKLIEIVKSKQ